MESDSSAELPEGLPPRRSSTEATAAPLSLLDRPSEGGASVASSDGRECQLSAAFVSASATLAALLEDADEGGAPAPLPHVSADELASQVSVHVPTLVLCAAHPSSVFLAALLFGRELILGTVSAPLAVYWEISN